MFLYVVCVTEAARAFFQWAVQKFLRRKILILKVVCSRLKGAFFSANTPATPTPGYAPGGCVYVHALMLHGKPSIIKL